MTTAKVLTIHEFSTGIQVQRTPDGGWESQGFTGQYMNSTLNPIPPIVKRAISNRLFAVAEGTSKDEPALIGREITENEETWSVIAVVSKGKDDHGRSSSLYRYFLSEGSGQLTPMLRWMLTQKKDYQFNPFDYQEVGQPHQADRDKNTPPIKEDWHQLLTASPPIILSPERRCSPLILNSLAIRKSEENGYPLAWAYQIEALEKPRSFQVIYPASIKAEQVLSKSLASSSKTPVFIDNEQDLNTAIKGIFRKGTIKVEQLLTLEQALQNPQITDDYWQNLFDGQGASKAIQQGIYSAQMVRLLALQAVILPKTLPKYLGWLDKKEKNEEGKKAFAEFQKQLRGVLAKVNPDSDFQELKQKVVQGVRLLIPSLVKQPNLLFSVVSLLKPQGSLWGYFYHYQVKSEIEQDFSAAPALIRGYKPDAVLILVEEEPLWEELFQDISSTWQRSRVSPKEKYLPLAQFFEEVSHFKPAALFYHIAWGEVPKEVFKNCGGQGNHYRKQIYEVWVKRHITFLEQAWNELVEIGGIIVPVYMFAPLLVLFFIVGGLALPRIFNTDIFAPNKSELKEAKEKLEVVRTQLNSVNSQAITKAVTDFDTTKTSLNSLIQQIPNEQGASSKEEKLIWLREEIFENESLQTTAILENNNTERNWKEAWAIAIYNYQQENELVADGIIHNNKDTYESIRDEIQDKLTNNSDEGES